MNETATTSGERVEYVKKVLLIDDDQRFLQGLARELLASGYRVDEAADGLEGIQKAVQDPPDIAVVDLILPRVGGDEVVAFFRQNPYLASVPIVLLSGVLLESATLIDTVEADVVLTKGPFAETSRLLLEALVGLVDGDPTDKQIITQPGIHERRQVVELLRIKRDLGAVLEGAAAGILELDTAARVAYANARAEELLGIGRASLIGTELVAVFPKAGVPALQALLSRFDGDLGPMSRAVTSALENRALRIVVSSVWHEGARQSLIVTLIEVGSELEAQNRPVRLLQYLSHEMRSSLLMIESSLRALARAGAPDASAARPGEQTPNIAFLAQETGRLLRLLGDASKFHRTLRELPEIEMDAIDLVSVIKDSISGISALAVPQGIDVSYRGPSLAPKVWGHHDKLLQVLYNLLMNALKSTARGGSVWIEMAVSDREIVTTVADTGRGLAAEDLREIMVQAQRAELFLPRKGKRVGLGLSIAHQIVQAHQGQFTAESTPGVGSRFSFTLPFWSERSQEAGARVRQVRS
jgi:signal transduction histidine kinase